MYPAAMTLPMPNGPCEAVALPEDNAARLSWLHETCLSSLNWESDAEEVSYLLLVDYDFPPELHDHLDCSPRAHEGREGPVRAAHRGHGGAPLALREARALPWHARKKGVDGKRLKFLRDALGARVWRLHRAYRFACSPFMAGFMELKHSERRQLQTAGSVVAEKVEAHPERHLRPLLHEPRQVQEHERLRGPGQVRAEWARSVTNFELQINDSEGFLAFVETLKTDRSKACMSVPTQVGARTLQAHDGEGLLPPHEEALPEDEAALHGHRLRDGADLRAAGPAPRHGRGGRRRDLSALSAAARSKAIEVMGQLGKLGDETFPARILEYVGLRSKMYSILTVQPDGARKEKRKIKGVPKKAVTNVRHLEYREVLEEGSERRAAFAQLRSRAHEIAVETVEKKSLSPFNDKVYGLDAHNLGHWRNLEQLRMLGAYAPPGSAPFDLVMEFLVGPPPLGPAPTLPLRLSRWA